MRTMSIRLAAVAAAGMLLFTACGDDSSDSSSATTTTAATTGEDLSAMLDGVELVKEDQLTICSDIPYTPFEFYEDEGEEELVGFDVEVADAMAASLGVTTDWIVTPFDGIIPSLVAGNCDVIVSAMTITDERKEQVNFTDGYFDSEQSLLVTTENEETYASLEDLAGQTIGVQSGTTGEAYVEDNLPEGATVKAFEGGEELFTALSIGDIAGAVQDYPVNFVAQQDDPELVITATFPTEEEYGMALTKENTALLEALNAALAALKDGDYQSIYDTWFPES